MVGGGRFVPLCLVFALAVPHADAAEGIDSIEDVRVAPLVTSAWGQRSTTGYSNTGSPCFNYYTPNGYHSGCSATALAQVLHYWRYPDSIPAKTQACLVDGVVTKLALLGGPYAWDDMPDVTTEATDVQREAIGRLVYDCALIQHSWFASGFTYAYGVFADIPLREFYGYANACSYLADDLKFATVRETVLASLDVGSPVIVSIYYTEGGDQYAHEVIVDGYGYQGGEEYLHVNFGYNGIAALGANAWYRLPELTAGSHVYDKIDGILYNIFPGDTGDVLSGRVTWTDGTPAAEVDVAVRAGTQTLKTVKTDANGIYAFILPGGKTYQVAVGRVKKTVALKASVSAVSDWSDPFAPYYSVPGTPGNSWGNDFAVSEADLTGGDEPEPPPPDEGAFGPFNPLKAVSAKFPYCGIVRKTDGSIYGTVTLKVGKASKKGVSKVSGSVVPLVGKKVTISSTPVPVNPEGSSKVEGVVVKKFGTMALEIGEKGFAATFETAEGTLLAETSDLTAGLANATARFAVKGLPAEIDGHPVFADCTPDGEPITVNAKGKWILGKAASVKYKKITVKDPVTKEKTVYYELQGLDDPKKPNRSGLKLTYTAKTGTFKGSFNLYYNGGTAEKPKLKKTAFTVTGLVVDGKGVGTATVKKSPLVLDIVIE